MKLGDDGGELFAGRALFRGWPRPAVLCPLCERASMALVSMEVCRGGRMTVIDGHGERHLAHEGTSPFEIRLVFDCGAHESSLHLAATDGGVSALAEVRPAGPAALRARARASTPASGPPAARSSRPSAKLVLVRGRPK